MPEKIKREEEEREKNATNSLYIFMSKCAYFRSQFDEKNIGQNQSVCLDENCMHLFKCCTQSILKHPRYFNRSD